MAPRNAVGRTAARGITAGSGSSMSRALWIVRNAWSGKTKIAACGAPALFALVACHRLAHQPGLPARSMAVVDETQAELMLQVLAAARSEQPPAEVLRKVMTAHGTEL